VVGQTITLQNDRLLWKEVLNGDIIENRVGSRSETLLCYGEWFSKEMLRNVAKRV
jgi:hypothetical protein